MIRLFREKAAWIGWAIVIFFGATLFAGSVFFGFSDTPSPATGSQARVDKVATLGETPILRDVFARSFSQIVGQLSEEQQSLITPELLEMLRYNALVQTMQSMLLLEGAEKGKMTLSSMELKQGMQAIYAQFDLKDKKALKQRLKELDYPYKTFMKEVKNDLLQRKFANSLQAVVTVSNEDVDSAYREVDVQQILFPIQSKEDIEVQTELADTVYEKITEGLSFDEAVSLYSDPSMAPEQGRLGWIKVGDVVRDFEKVAFALNVGEVSRPIRTMFGIHLIKVKGKRELDRPETLDYEAEKAALLEREQKRVLQTYFDSIMSLRSLVITDPYVKPYPDKLKGDFDAAIGAYQSQVSLNPSSPVPHYMIAKVHLFQNRPSSAIAELEKADIKVEVSPQLDFPQLRFLMADLYLKQNQQKSAYAQYEKLLALVNTHEGLLLEFKKVLETQPLKKKAELINKIALAVQALAEQRAAELEAAEPATVPGSE
ncbi:MAG: hypothetical protein CL521_02985 [Actinobacteria bacterium]|nr:hypothetical protein [Actinomycetota bacterium]